MKDKSAILTAGLDPCRVPPKTGRYGGNVSFWYGAAPAAGVGIIVACFIYWYGIHAQQP